MFVDTIKYKDFNGEETEEKFYFHLSASDIARIELSHQGRGKSGMVEELERIIRKQNGAEIVQVFEKFVADSYGVRSDDGTRFIKNPQVLEEFRSSGAYDVFFLKLVTDAEFGAKFINGLLPADLQAQAQTLMENQKKQDTTPSLAVVAPTPAEDHLLDDPSFNVPATLAVVPEPLSSEDFGHDKQKPSDEEIGQFVENATEKVRKLLAMKPKDMTKDELVMAMKLKTAVGKVITAEEINAWTPEMLELMIAAGAKVEGFEE